MLLNQNQSKLTSNIVLPPPASTVLNLLHMAKIQCHTATFFIHFIEFYEKIAVKYAIIIIKTEYKFQRFVIDLVSSTKSFLKFWSSNQETNYM